MNRLPWPSWGVPLPSNLQDGAEYTIECILSKFEMLFRERFKGFFQITNVGSYLTTDERKKEYCHVLSFDVCAGMTTTVRTTIGNLVGSDEHRVYQTLHPFFLERDLVEKVFKDLRLEAEANSCNQ